MGKSDLHTHTKESDGALSAEQLIERAKKKGLKAISITDHDTINGYKKARPAANEAGIELIPGIEITALWNKREVHILAYLFDTENPKLLALLKRQRLARIKRMRDIVEVLRGQGLDISLDEVRAESGTGSPGRPHAASVLISKGYVASVAEAFIRYLSSEKLKGIRTDYATVEEVVKIVKEAHGVLSLAHPGPLYSQKEINTLLEFGIDGIECIHPSHNFNLQRSFTKMAESRHLLITGGSDFHGKRKSEYDPYFGIVTLGDKHLASMKRLAQRRKTEQKS
ncbi:PHP domain-containing protein [Rhodohalobacter mucosus]|uniref:PHP domain-containing protein n=1 Tax=Rhodohalobacter mucosus TaxID=2079485 RepID=UPI001FA89F28|nr:PHP domain-containing protein [Rhodohalobacter mucosus]